jgi:glycine/D-amino acid oxidase-like deaminating enzyme
VTFDCVVVGAGVHGLCTTFWLRELGLRRLALCDRGEPGHTQGSSHGGTRITRSTYADPAWVALATEARDQGWPALERAFGTPLRLPTPGVFTGPGDGPFADYLRATRSCPAIEPLPLAAARQQFPWLRLRDGEQVLLDHSAAVVLAARTMAALREHAAAHGTTLHWQSPVARIDPAPHGVTVWTDRGPLAARAVVLAAGAGAPRLAPAHPRVTVLRQQVGYFDVDAPAAQLAAGTFPVWCRIGRQANEFCYGLPDVDGAGLKLAQHVTEGPGIDPDAPTPAPDRDALLALAREHLLAPVRGLRRSESCLYTMTADHGFTVAADPVLPRLVHVVACSGHAFKFAPVLGRRAAECVLAALR